MGMQLRQRDFRQCKRKEMSDKCMPVRASTITYVQHVSVPEVIFSVPAPLVQSNVLCRKALQQLQDLRYHLIHLCSIACVIVLNAHACDGLIDCKFKCRTTSRGYKQQCFFLSLPSAWALLSYVRQAA